MLPAAGFVDRILSDHSANSCAGCVIEHADTCFVSGAMHLPCRRSVFRVEKELSIGNLAAVEVKPAFRRTVRVKVGPPLLIWPVGLGIPIEDGVSNDRLFVFVLRLAPCAFSMPCLASSTLNLRRRNVIRTRSLGHRWLALDVLHYQRHFASPSTDWYCCPSSHSSLPCPM